MKKTGKIIVALLAAAAILLSMAACGGKADGKLMQEIFDKLTANADYTEWKSGFNTTTFEEKLDGDSIVISAKGEEGLNGDYTFTLDGDYIVTTSDEGDYSAYSIMTYLKSAVADYYGMNNMLMTGYLAGLGYIDAENKFFITETADGKTTTKLYAAGKWEMEGLDKMFVNEAALEYYDALGEDSTSLYVNAGKITSAAIGSAEKLDLMVGEYGENTELTFRSIVTIVNKLQPNGYETFVREFTELKEVSGDGYTVSFGIPQAVADDHIYTPAEGYSYVTVVFGADAAESAEEPAAEEDGQNPVMNFIGEYSADRCTITIGANGMDGATVSVHWGQSASETYEYTMTGDFDPDTMRIHYSDCEKKLVTYDENGDVARESVEYTDGAGRIQFFEDGTLRWEDENEADRLVGMTFAFNA